MKQKMIVKIGFDFVMTILLLLLMARQLTGESAHEWLGLGMFIFWIVHHILNFRWYGYLFKGKYTPFRVVQVVVNLLLLLSMIGTMVSAVILSREVFAFQFISGGIGLARLIPLFFTEYLAIMGLFIFLTHYGTKGLQKMVGKRR